MDQELKDVVVVVSDIRAAMSDMVRILDSVALPQLKKLDAEAKELRAAGEKYKFVSSETRDLIVSIQKPEARFQNHKIVEAGFRNILVNGFPFVSGEDTPENRAVIDNELSQRTEHL
jgi:hypothetical protein